MKFDELDESLQKYSLEDEGFNQTIYEFTISNEDFNSFKGEYIEPVVDVAKHVGKSIKGAIKPISDKIGSVIASHRDKKFIIDKIEKKLSEDDLLDRLLSNGFIKVTLSKVDNEYLVKIKSKSEERIRYYLISHQLDKDGEAEFGRFKEMREDKIPKLIRSAKKEFKLNIANETVETILDAFEDIYGIDKLEELKRKIK